MKIIINQTSDDLDPNETTENPVASLAAYIGELTKRILVEYPDADIEHMEVSDTYAFRVSDDPDGSIAENIQEMSEEIFEQGNFWS